MNTKPWPDLPGLATRDAIVAALHACHIDLKIALVFGSVARGCARSDSDLDIAVATDRALTAAEKISLIAQLAEISGRAIDLVDLYQVGEPLLGEILRDGIQLLGDTEMFTRLVLRHIYATADFVPIQQRILAERRQAWIGT